MKADFKLGMLEVDAKKLLDVETVMKKIKSMVLFYLLLG